MKNPIMNTQIKFGSYRQYRQEYVILSIVVQNVFLRGSPCNIVAFLDIKYLALMTDFMQQNPEKFNDNII